MRNKFVDLGSAYGQLILLIFLPILSLSIVGSIMVYSATMEAKHNEQRMLAKTILIRYQPLIKQRLPLILNHKNAKADNELQKLFFKLQTQSELQRIAIIKGNGEVVDSAGFKSTQNWGNVKPDLEFKTKHQINYYNKIVPYIETEIGTAYGINLGKINNDDKTQSVWLFVDMDNNPLKLAQYHIILALVFTSLLTVVMLLLSLGVYYRRWIKPMYQLRLFLSSLNINNLKKSFVLGARGELLQLKEDFIHVLYQIDKSVQELKRHTEQTENDLRQAFDEMEMQNISIRNSRDKAVSTSEAKSAFLANISHELRTPLNSIDGFINLLARHGDLSSEQDLYVQTIRKSSAHLLALVNDVLDFSKIEAGKLVLSSHEFDLYDTIYDVADMLSPLANEKGLRLAVLFYNDVPLTIIGDALRVKQVLTNLVANAIKFTDNGSVMIKVSLDDKADNYVSISVQDSGLGVNEINEGLLFRNFTQVDPSITRQYGGTGLGLVISKQLTLLMKGNIGYYDNAKQNIASTGSTFWFSMPAHIDVLDVDHASNIELPMLETAKNKDDKRLKILVWMNHADSMQVLKASLRPLPIDIIETYSLVGMLDTLKEQKTRWDWVIVDGEVNSTSTEHDDSMVALLKQLRLHYQGKLAVYGYQVALDNTLLTRYKANALYEPIDKRQLFGMLDKRKNNTQVVSTEKWQGYRVLAVDDHLPNLLVLDALLVEQGIEVVTANNGFDAIEMISKQTTDESKKIDLIFMDIQMPRMSGHEASKQIRKVDNREPHIPIVALTAHGLSDERDKLIKSGIDDYVSKPISQPQLLQILQKWLGKKHIQQSAVHSVNLDHTDVEIQPMTALSAVQNRQTPYENLLILDWDDAVVRSSDNPELAVKLMTMMFDTIEEEKQELMQAREENDHIELAQISHRLLGATRYTGVPQLRYASEQLENACMSDDDRKFVSSYEALLQALDNLIEVDINVWLQQHYHKGDEDSMTWKMI